MFTFDYYQERFAVTLRSILSDAIWLYLFFFQKQCKDVSVANVIMDQLCICSIYFDVGTDLTDQNTRILYNTDLYIIMSGISSIILLSVFKKR